MVARRQTAEHRIPRLENRPDDARKEPPAEFDVQRSGLSADLDHALPAGKRPEESQAGDDKQENPERRGSFNMKL